MTLKAVRTLREADIVVMPVTENSDGTTKSRAADIIGEWCAKEKMQRYVLPMQRNREAVMQVYDHMCREVTEWYHDGRRVVVAVEGDVSIYASIHYVLDQLQRKNIPVVQEPGIPSLYPDAVCHYFENVGTAEAFHTSQCDEILSRQMPYFSLCILFPA